MQPNVQQYRPAFSSSRDDKHGFVVNCGHPATDGETRPITRQVNSIQNRTESTKERFFQCTLYIFLRNNTVNYE